MLQGKSAVTMENKERAGRGWRRQEAAADAPEDPGETLQTASAEQKEAPSMRRPSTAERKSQEGSL